MALATGTHVMAKTTGPDDPSWQQLRGVSYVRRAVTDNTLSPDFPMLRNQAGVGGVGTYWVTLGYRGAGRGRLRFAYLSGRGGLADAFLGHRATPDRVSLRRVINGEKVVFTKPVLADWGRVAHLGAAFETGATAAC